jgi:predicted O-linked N-acetylglucosamine transferase (SPINDLY family)
MGQIRMAVTDSSRGANPFDRALAAYARERLSDARLACREALRREPRHAGALTLMGLLELREGRARAAIDVLGKALRIDPQNALAHYHRGNALFLTETYAAALASYEAVLALQPGHVDAIYNRANTLRKLARHDEAIAGYAAAIAIKPDFAAAHLNGANAARDAGRFAAALAGYDRAIAFGMADAGVHNNRGTALHAERRYAEALASLDRALALDPGFAAAHHNRGIVLSALARFEDAVAACDAALAAAPDFAEALDDRGLALYGLGRFDAAIASHERAIARRPDVPRFHLHRGNAAHSAGRIDEALNDFGRALALAPDYAEAHNNLGNALLCLGRNEEALRSFDRAIAIRPDFADAYSNRGRALRELQRIDASIDSYAQAIALGMDPRCLDVVRRYLRMRHCDWSGLDADLGRFTAAIEAGEPVAPPFALLTLVDDGALQRRAAQIWCGELFGEDGVLGPVAARVGGGGAGRERIRVGYFSADYRDHATMHLMAGLFELHDREGFEVTAFSFGPVVRDAMRERVAGACERFVEVGAHSDREVAGMARELGIDIAVDLKGYTSEARPGIFAHRAAPVQVGYLGYPGTLGAPYVDYLVADRMVVPAGSEGYYEERIVYLPHSYQVNDGKRRIGTRRYARAELGLPEAGFVYCCFNNNYKILPATFGSWMRILGRVPGSVLWLLEDNALAARNLRAAAEARGIGAERLVFAPRVVVEEHLARHGCADLFLDTLPCNAHTTASDALWAGLPVLTCAGQGFAARVAASVVQAAGLGELIVGSMGEYEELAVELAGDAGRLAGLRTRLERARHTAPLFDTERYARHLESAYALIHARHRAGLPPASIEIPAATPASAATVAC